MLGARVHQVLVERRVRRRERDVARLALELPVPEDVHLVFLDRAAVGADDLLVRVRKDLMADEVLGAPFRVAEVAREGAGRRVGARPGDGVHLDARRAPLRGVEAVGDHLELGDRLAAEVGVGERAGDRLRHLLSIHRQVVGALDTAAAPCARDRSTGAVGADFVRT